LWLLLKKSGITIWKIQLIGLCRREKGKLPLAEAGAGAAIKEPENNNNARHYPTPIVADCK